MQNIYIYKYILHNFYILATSNTQVCGKIFEKWSFYLPDVKFSGPFNSVIVWEWPIY